MGSVAKHRHKTTLRTLLIASGLAVAVLAACVWAAVASGGTSQASQAALAEVPPLTAPRPDPVATRTPDRASRDDARTPLPTPTPERKVIARPKPKRTAYRVLGSGSCQASYYGEPQATASGEPFNPNALTAAHKTLPLGSKVRVTNVNNGQTVLVRINDRGPYVGGRCLDLSTAAMKAVGGIGSGVIPVKYQVLGHVGS